MSGVIKHDPSNCELPNCETCYPELAAMFASEGWVEVKHVCTLVRVDFVAKKILETREISS